MTNTRRLEKGDHEFLPAALELLETPPSPIRMVLLISICFLFIVAIAWSWFGTVDIVAVASGKIQPAGRVQVVQPAEAGDVLKLNVRNGQRVKKGDVLVELSRTSAKADVDATQRLFYSVEAEIIWRKLLAKIIAERGIGPLPAAQWTASIPEDVRVRENRVYLNTAGQLKSVIAALIAQRDQKQAERDKLLSTVKSQELFVRTLQDRVDMRQTLVQLKSGSKASLIDALEKLREQQTQLSSQAGQAKETSAALIVLDREKERTFLTAAADNSQKLSAAERQKDELVQRLSKAQSKFSNMLIKAPVAGTVQALSIINPGQVVAAGEHIMRIVPEGTKLEIEAYALNKDIGFIKEGQEAVIKIESFPFTRFGTIQGVVKRVARDAVTQPDATQATNNPGQSSRPLGPGGTQGLQNLVFQIVIEPKKLFVTAEGRNVPLGPGMAVSAEIKTGKRRMMEFVFAPLFQTGSQAMKER